MGFVVLGIVAAFLAVILIRALLFKPKAEPALEHEEICFDREAAVKALAELIRCKTVSYAEHELEDDAEFEKLIGLLPSFLFFSKIPFSYSF